MATEISRRHLSDDEAAKQICTTLSYGGRQFRLGEYVALLDGEVIAVADNFEAVHAALRDREPDWRRGLILQVATPEPDVIR
jgi:hypothetical protein